MICQVCQDVTLTNFSLFQVCKTSRHSPLHGTIAQRQVIAVGRFFWCGLPSYRANLRNRAKGALIPAACVRVKDAISQITANGEGCEEGAFGGGGINLKQESGGEHLDCGVAELFGRTVNEKFPTHATTVWLFTIARIWGKIVISWQIYNVNNVWLIAFQNVPPPFWI